MAHNTGLDESVLPLLHPLRSLRFLDLSNSNWLSDRGLYLIGGFQGLSEVNVAQCFDITVPGIVEMVSRSCAPLIRVTVGQPLDCLSGYHAGIEHRLCGPVCACSVYCEHNSRFPKRIGFSGCGVLG